ncbi:myelin and lymphocyte protein [Latimeria chalumnae]|uniref:myelin and lymphocyte protein n=1 Tax=Latimeria chalumnae TaxID=7897 RepID=UPI00313AAC85
MAQTTADPVYGTVADNRLPAGLDVIRSLPDVLMIPELVFGGLVWILVAATNVIEPNPQGWVMFVSLFCFVGTFTFFILFCANCHKNSSTWGGLDCFYHGIAALFYLSAAVVLAYSTVQVGNQLLPLLGPVFKAYQEEVAATVFAFVATLLYVIHTILSVIRWKSL